MIEGSDTCPKSPFNVNGSLSPKQLSKNITNAFRLAARIYLCSLVPGFNPSQPSPMALVDKLTTVLQHIPSGPEGFDRSLVWGLFDWRFHQSPRQQLSSAVRGPGCPTWSAGYMWLLWAHGHGSARGVDAERCTIASQHPRLLGVGCGAATHPLAGCHADEGVGLPPDIETSVPSSLLGSSIAGL